MAKIIDLSQHPAFRSQLIATQMESNSEAKAPPEEEWEEDDDVLVLSQEDMSNLVDAYKMVQDGLDRIKEITKLDYEEGAYE